MPEHGKPWEGHSLIEETLRSTSLCDCYWGDPLLKIPLEDHNLQLHVVFPSLNLSFFGIAWPNLNPNDPANLSLRYCLHTTWLPAKGSRKSFYGTGNPRSQQTGLGHVHRWNYVRPIRKGERSCRGLWYHSSNGLCPGWLLEDSGLRVIVRK